MVGVFEADPMALDPRRQPASFTTDDVPLDLGQLQKLAARSRPRYPSWTAPRSPSTGAGCSP